MRVVRHWVERRIARLISGYISECVYVVGGGLVSNKDFTIDGNRITFLVGDKYLPEDEHERPMVIGIKIPSGDGK